MNVSLIVTVLNEGDSIRALLDSIVEQTYQPDEVIICDGGSDDNTVDILNSYAKQLPLTVIVQEGTNIAEGRNTAIAAASNDLIAVTDAGVRLHRDWLYHLLAKHQPTNENQSVAGFFLPDTDTPFEVAMGATVLPEQQDINLAKFMPSSRSVLLHKSAWQRVGGYPEWLDFCEDLILDFNIHTAAGGFDFAPDAIVYFRPRASLRAFWKQYYQYARGDGKANLFFKRHAIRYLTYLVALPAIILAGLVLNPLWWFLLLFGGLYMVWVPYRRLFNQWSHLTPLGKIQAFLQVPVIRIYGDIAKMFGYPVGVVWRWTNSPPDWRIQSHV